MKTDDRTKTSLKKLPAVPEGGTLGLLAHGWRGIMAWRSERHRLEAERLTTNEAQQARDEEN